MFTFYIFIFIYFSYSGRSVMFKEAAECKQKNFTD